MLYLFVLPVGYGIPWFKAWRYHRTTSKLKGQKAGGQITGVLQHSIPRLVFYTPLASYSGHIWAMELSRESPAESSVDLTYRDKLWNYLLLIAFPGRLLAGQATLKYSHYRSACDDTTQIIF